MNLPVPQHGDRVGAAVQQALNMIVRMIALLLGWQLDSVANIAALGDVDDTRIPDGSGKFVRTVLDTFHLDKDSTAVVDGITVVATQSGTGRWIRDVQPNAHWNQQPTWYINATLGNDENAGNATGAGALATFAEWKRRVEQNGVDVAMTINIETDLPASDPVGVVGGGEFLTIVGTLNTVYSGEVAAFTRDTATNVIGTVQDLTWTVADHLQKRIKFTSGAANGMFAWICQDLTGGSARLSRILSSAFASANPGVGDTFEVQVATSVYFGTTRYNGALFLTNLDQTNYATSTTTMSASGIVAKLCRIAISDRGTVPSSIQNCLTGFLRFTGNTYGGVHRTIHIIGQESTFNYEPTLDSNISGPSSVRLQVSSGAVVVSSSGLWLFGTETINLLRGSILAMSGSSALRGIITATRVFESMGTGACFETSDVSIHTISEKTIAVDGVGDIELNAGPYQDPHTGARIGIAVGGGSGAQGPISVGVKGALTAGTRFALQDLTEAAAAADMPIVSANRCFIRNLRAHLGTAPGGADTVVVTVFVNGVATTITCTISAANTDASDLTHAAIVAPGDLISFQVVKSGAAAANLSVSLEAA